MLCLKIQIIFGLLKQRCLELFKYLLFMKGYWYKIEVERFLSVGLSVTFAFLPPDFYESDMTEMDESDPPFSACVRVTTRGQTPALILFYLKIPETSE